MINTCLASDPNHFGLTEVQLKYVQSKEEGNEKKSKKKELAVACSSICLLCTRVLFATVAQLERFILMG